MIDERGATAKGIARAAAVNQTYVRDILLGKSRHPQVDKLQRVAAALGTTVDRLLGNGGGQHRLTVDGERWPTSR